MFNYRKMGKSLPEAIGILLVSIFLSSCFHDAASSDTAKVSFKHPNLEGILPNTHSLEVSVVYPNGDSVLIYSGSSLQGPWAGVINKSNLVLVIIQLDSAGLEIKRETYSYIFQNGTLKIENKLEVNPESLELVEAGPPFQINAKLFPSDLDLPISWVSSNGSIASVTSQGVVDPVSSGDVLIIASAGNDLKDTVFVGVKEDPNIINPSDSLVFLETLTDTLLPAGTNFFITAKVNQTTNLNYSWEKNGQEISDSASMFLSSVAEQDSGFYIVTITWEEKTVVDSFRITIDFNPTYNITVSTTGQGRVVHEGDTVTVLTLKESEGADFQFIPDSGYQIKDVLVDEVLNEDAMAASSYTFTNVTASHTLEVSFSKKNFTLDVSINDTTKGSVGVLPAGNLFEFGDSVYVTAVPKNENFKFTGWSGDVVSDADSLMLIMDENLSMTANFGDIGQYSVNVSLSPDNLAGSVSKTPDNISYLAGSQLILEASPNIGFQFDSWSGNDPQITGTNTQLTIGIEEKDLNVVANFSKISLNLDFATLPASGNPGVPAALPGTIYWGDTIEIRATPNSSQGWEFIYWELSNISEGRINYVSDTDSSMETAQIVVTEGDINIAAHYRIKQFSVDFNLDNKGTRTSGGALRQTISFGTAANAPVVTPNAGWLFDGWDVDFSNVTSDLSVTAEYSRQSFSVTVSAGSGGSVNPSGATLVEYGSDLAISATADNGGEFINWTTTAGLSVENPDSPTTSVVNVTSGGTVSANFWACGDDLVDNRPNMPQTTYSTFSNASQCWFGDNVNAGGFLDASRNQDSANGIIEKYCWDNETDNCTSSGGLYTWAEAMQGDTLSKSQGICPNGWHIPDSTEFQSLIDNNVDMGWDVLGYFDLVSRNFNAGTWGGYWLSSTYGGPIAPNYASRLSGDIEVAWTFSQTGAMFIRCIKDP